MVEAVRILSAEKEFFALEKMIAAGINCKNNEATLLQICLNLVAFFFFFTRLLLREREGIKTIQCDRFVISKPGRRTERQLPDCPGLDLES